MKVSNLPMLNTRKVREMLFIKAKGLQQEMRKYPECHQFYRSLLRDTIDVYKKSGRNPEVGFKMLFDDYMRKDFSNRITAFILGLDH